MSSADFNIKVALRDSPVSLKLYSLCYGEMTLYDLENMTFLDVAGCKHRFFDDGRICNHGEVMLFPNQSRNTWRKWQYYIFNIDHYVTDTDGEVRFIIGTDIERYTMICYNGETEYKYINEILNWNFASKELIDDFNRRLEEVGYRIVDNKLEVINKPVYKVGQTITSKDGRGVWHARIREVNETSYYCDTDDGTATISFSAQNKYELVNE